MKDSDLKMRLKKWIAQIGPGEAQSRLISAGMSGSTALKLVVGTYKSQPKRLLLQAIESAMKDAG